MANPTESDGQKFSHLYSYSGANKAGMDGIDKEKQAHIIYELSKDSAYFKRAAKLDAETDAKVQIMKKTLINFKGSVEHGLREKVLNMSMELESYSNVANALHVRGMIYVLQGEYNKAVNVLEECIRKGKILGEGTEEATSLMINFLNTNKSKSTITEQPVVAFSTLT